MSKNPASTPPPADLPDEDFLKGAKAIGAHLRSEGLSVTDGGVYYIARSRKLSIGKWGKNLIASKRRLSRDLRRAAQALTTEQA